MTAEMIAQKTFLKRSELLAFLRVKLKLVTDRIRSMGKGNGFTDVCHYVHRGGGCIYPPLARTQTAACGRYASYWNAYLYGIE